MTSVSLRSLRGRSKHVVPTARGFSIIEVIVSMAIISVITTMVMVRYSSFNSSSLLRNQAYEIALDIREAQVFATSIRSDSNEFREEYGVRFDTTAGETQQYTFWRDIGTDEPPVFNSGEALNVLGLDSRFAVYAICFNGAAVGSCSATTADISFRRPNFDALIIQDGSFQAETVTLYIAPTGETSPFRTVTITQTGQITVD